MANSLNLRLEKLICGLERLLTTLVEERIQNQIVSLILY